MSDLGTCPNCGSPLMNWGAASHGDGDIFDEIGCDVCEEVIYEKHASYCECVDCAPYLSADDDDAEQCVHTDPPSALVSAADSTNTAGG